jgi:peptidyl-prolyl cis-trans isomerase D
MESAIAALQLNEVSPAVQSDAGWHIIKLTEIRTGENRSFDDVRPELESQLQTAEAGRELVKTVEQLRNLVFNADDLSGPAGEVGLSVLQSDAITRDQREGLFANPRLLAAAFSTEVLNDGFNSDVIEIDPEHFVVLRKNTHSLPAVEPLESVRDRVVASIIQESASQAIREKASSLLAELRNGASIEDVALANQYQWQVELGAKRDNRDVPPTLLRRAFQLPAPTEGERALEYVQNNEGDIELFELVRVIPGDVSKLNAARREALGSRMMNELARRADELYQQELQAHAEIERS